MAMRCACFIAACCLALPIASGAQEASPRQPEASMSDAAIVALIIATSVAAYKANGKPCACPSDTMRNGRTCGPNSAYLRPSGHRPFCFPADVTAAMITAYRATKALPLERP